MADACDLRMSASPDSLLSGDPWVELVARRDLLDEPVGPQLRARVDSDTRVADLLAATDPSPPERRSTNAYDAKDAIWKVGVLADFGLEELAAFIGSFDRDVAVFVARAWTP